MAGEALARAKVNLFLHVIGRRADGMHRLDSLAVFPPVGDVIARTPHAPLSLQIDGPFAAGLVGEADNLVLRAARGFSASAGRVAEGAFRLTKNLPVASGIGGGSADAAAALRLLAADWGCAVPAELAVSLGADVPVCVASEPARMGGIGELLLPAPDLPGFSMVLVNPGVAVATADIFRARSGGFSEPANLPASWPDATAMAADLAQLRNDLEPPALALEPIIGTVLNALRAQPGCLLARMSGSGATCFALFANAADALSAASALRQPGWWVWGGDCAAAPARQR
ncbi:MAG TPA: 4-(cytidine 5'-diphospho)-2-C-methyl-D-erythritol kinase [Acidiphilium sp.]|nr:MAG: 4-(cytidine 5'-diphospho)-2-C-methyl-D-erythritol kinase [Acidiphilium sp. 21-60-14]OYV90275.1 MAG: 4-(cytidine 5'-diphospho)-2-C-methyl-D-erythritol kinase [Acidiphilium sp. 37-60-79]HQT89074.1 4-(cytidine 5'-diphospho)-2-C-methyl-D-erythritol kinase [Acidiphilium sp.]HQU24356.1 4-(cytidine 5'-diphospho)-2-C-methyl-D-erythritol kinase [Acidiphilium sp.]